VLVSVERGILIVFYQVLKERRERCPFFLFLPLLLGRPILLDNRFADIHVLAREFPSMVPSFPVFVIDPVTGF
jgi:hypothetical protein